MNQHSTLRQFFTRILLCMPVAGMLASPALAAGDAQPAPVRDGWGSAVAWGDNDYDQINIPTDLGTVIQVAARGIHTVALQSDGVVRAWGNNTYGQTTVPTDLGAVIQVAAGARHTVALQSDGAVRAWGNNQYGQTTVPTDLGAVIQVAAGGFHTVALQSDGAVRAWGDNYYRQIDVPTDLGTVIQVAAGSGHTVALQSDGAVRAWGDNQAGQTTVPSNINVVTQVAAGGYHTVVISATAGELASHIMDQAAAHPELDAQVTLLQGDLLVKTEELSNCETDKTGLQGDLLIKTTELSDCETEKAAALARGASRARGDVNDDSAIGQQDLLRILLHWGPPSAADNSARMKDLHKSIRASLKEIRRMRR